VIIAKDYSNIFNVLVLALEEANFKIFNEVKFIYIKNNFKALKTVVILMKLLKN